MVLLTVLAGCASPDPDESLMTPSSPLGSPSPAVMPEENQIAAIPAVPPATLTPLPTPAQVQDSVSRGRVDPFAPLAGGAISNASSSQPGSVPIRLQGVLSVGGQLQALVSIPKDSGAISGAICVGPSGRCGSELKAILPQDWSVLRIDLQRGCLTYAVAGKAQEPVCLVESKA